MRYHIFCGLAVLIVTARVVQADDFSDFRIPTHRVWTVTGDLQGSYHPERRNSSESSYRSNNSMLSLGASSYWLYDSDPLRLEWTGSGTATGSLDNYRRAGGNENRTTNRNSSEEFWSISGDSRYYPFAIPVGAEAFVSASARYAQSWYSEHHTDAHYLNPDVYYRELAFLDSSRWNYNYYLMGSMAIGYGRVRDATDVYRAYILEQRLLETGALIHPLSHKAKTEMAALYYTQNEFDHVHDRSLKFFWEEVERVLRNDGALRDSTLDAYNLYRLSEPYTGPWDEWKHGYYYPPRPRPDIRSYAGGYLRETGYFVGAMIDYMRDHDVYRTWRRERSTEFRNDSLLFDDVTFDFKHYDSPYELAHGGLKGEYHRPLGFRWQFDGETSVTIPINEFRRGYDFDVRLIAAFLMTDRLHARCSLTYTRTDEDVWYGISPKVSSDDWYCGIGVDVEWYVEDRMALTASLSHTQSHVYDREGGSYANTYESFLRSTFLEIGLSYRFLGRLDIPGLGIAEQLLPMRF